VKAMEVYIEVTYIINALIILLTIEILCFLLNQQLQLKEIIKYVIAYNISFLFLFIDFFQGFLLVYDFLLTFYFFKKLVYIYYPLYVFIYISILVFVDVMLPSSTIFQGILIVEGIKWYSLFALSFMMICIFYFYISFCQYKIKDKHMVDVCFFGIKCLGFIDTGNKVYYHGYPVVFINESLIKDYKKIDVIQIETASAIENIDIIEIDKMSIQGKEISHVYAGMISSKEYDCILNSDLLGGLL
jgi:hypothetical protein